MSYIGTVIQNYFKISNASYTPSIIPYEFIYSLRIVASEFPHVLLENQVWRMLSRPPGNTLRLAILVDARATSLMLTPTHRIFPCQKSCNAAIEVFTSKPFLRVYRISWYYDIRIVLLLNFMYSQGKFRTSIFNIRLILVVVN